ncbi:DUF4935 domain-containing protein [candidate division KSB1 bacterium]|nr:DUF4935 domain-containing protein [candidate division KSB1 bacterium]
MDIILDTNIFVADYKMLSHRFKILFDYLYRTKSSIIIPQLVLDELEAVYERELKNKINTFSIAIGNLERLLLESPFKLQDIQVESEVASYIKFFKSKLELTKEHIIDYQDSYLHNVMTRAIRRTPPCSAKGEEIRDAVLWNTILDIAAEAFSNKVIFISNNTKQFALHDNTLHPELMAETEKKGVSIEYYSSLEEFIKHHATKIDFISHEWFHEQTYFNKIYKRAWADATNLAKRKLTRSLDINQSATGEIISSSGDFDLDEYFVYEMADGSLEVEGVLYGNIEYEFEIEESIEDKIWEYELEFNPKTGDYECEPNYCWKTETKLKKKNILIELQVTFNAIIIDKNLVDCDIVEVAEL